VRARTTVACFLSPAERVSQKLKAQFRSKAPKAGRHKRGKKSQTSPVNPSQRRDEKKRKSKGVIISGESIGEFPDIHGLKRKQVSSQGVSCKAEKKGGNPSAN